MASTLSPSSSTYEYLLFNSILFNGSASISCEFINYLLQFIRKGSRLSLCKKYKFEATIKVVIGLRISSTTSWEEKPFEILPDGRWVYLDEQDIVTFLDSPKHLIPLDPSYYNPSSYLK